MYGFSGHVDERDRREENLFAQFRYSGTVTPGRRLVVQNSNKLIGVDVIKKESTTRYSRYNDANLNENGVDREPATIFVITVIIGELERGLGGE